MTYESGQIVIGVGLMLATWGGVWLLFAITNLSEGK